MTIYLDHNATTPVAPEVWEAMEPFQRGHFANPSSSSTLSRTVKRAITHAREDCAALLDALKIDSCFVLGWSDGGIVALLLAMRHPGKVISLASTGANIWPDSTALIPAYWKEEQVEYEAGRKKTGRTAVQRNA